MSSKNIEDVESKGFEEHLEHKVEHDHVAHEANKAALAQAVAAEDREHMGAWEALKLFPKAAFWSVMVSCVIVSPSYCVYLIADHGGLRCRPHW